MTLLTTTDFFVRLKCMHNVMPQWSRSTQGLSPHHYPRTPHESSHLKLSPSFFNWVLPLTFVLLTVVIFTEFLHDGPLSLFSHLNAIFQLCKSSFYVNHQKNYSHTPRLWNPSPLFFLDSVLLHINQNNGFEEDCGCWTDIGILPQF